MVPLFSVNAQVCDTTKPVTSAVCNPAPGWFISYQDNSVRGVITMIIQFLLLIVGLVAIAFIIYGGFQFITSRGDEEQATAGKRTLTNAIIGLVIVILSYIIVAVIVNALKGSA
ncbi:MAG: hypothetical protein A3K08_02360 [Candidatus Doudnabacteria bacterium RIFCSPLOWO2_01_41_7]|nr:MAG: hypothetical protein A3K08_02360 [Candidatus Doudnabacteria bacterium RIFCSPLOWO2_01_41_7]